MYNAGVTLLEGALADVIGGGIDLRALRTSGDVSTLRYLYADQAGRDAVVRRVKEHPGLARAVSYLNKVTVLSPKDVKAFAHLYSLHQFTKDEPALRALEQRARAAGLDTSDQIKNATDFINRAKDQEYVPKIAAALARSEKMSAALRPKGGRTAAAALGRQVEGLLSLEAYTGTADLDKAVALAEEAQRLAPSSRTSGMVTAARLFRGARQLRRSDPAFDAFFEKYVRSVGTSHLMAVAAGEAGPFQQAVLRHPDVQKAIAAVRDEARRFSEGGSSYDWALLKSTDPAEAERIAGIIRKAPRKQVEHSLSTVLRPASASEALEMYWLLQILGKPAEASQALSAVAGKGIPVPIRP
jgi:hypothetical protein